MTFNLTFTFQLTVVRRSYDSPECWQTFPQTTTNLSQSDSAECRSKNSNNIYSRSLFMRIRPLLSSCVSVSLSVRRSAWNNSVPTGRIFMKFDIWSVRVKHLVSHWTDFHEIWYLVGPRETTRFPLERFSWNLIFGRSAWNNSVPTGRIFMKFDIWSVRVKQLGSHWKDFHEIWYLVGPRETTRLPLEGFSWNLIFGRSAWNNSVPTGKIFMKFDIWSVRVKHLVSHWTDFHVIWYLVGPREKTRFPLERFSWNLIFGRSAWNNSFPTGRIFMKFDI